LQSAGSLQRTACHPGIASAAKHDALGIFVLAEVVLDAGEPSADGHAGLVDARRTSGHQGMPRIEGQPVADEAIGAGRRKPRDAAHRLRRQPDAIGHLLLPSGIIPAAASEAVEKRATDIRVEDLAAILVFQLEEAAAATAVAEAFPLGGGHRLQRLRPPERFVRAGTVRRGVGPRAFGREFEHAPVCPRRRLEARGRHR